MNKQIRNDEFWLYVPMFVKKHVLIPTLGIEILGYFPYHIARIASHDKIVTIPRSFLHEFENILCISHMKDNKAVYICKSHGLTQSPQRFAIMVKDDWAAFGTWEDIVQYDGGSFRFLNVHKHSERDWPCDHCIAPEPEYCMNCCPLKKETNEKTIEKDSPSTE